MWIDLLNYYSIAFVFLFVFILCNYFVRENPFVKILNIVILYFLITSLIVYYIYTNNLQSKLLTILSIICITFAMNILSGFSIVELITKNRAFEVDK
ncbi:MAG: hypothetical protein LBT02_04065 [Rickettsiales bacterium]|jgi:hypothetical protein|nr:hypothetical protein [Rickettsiales bacterium]